MLSFVMCDWPFWSARARGAVPSEGRLRPTNKRKKKTNRNQSESHTNHNTNRYKKIHPTRIHNIRYTLLQQSPIQHTVPSASRSRSQAPFKSLLQHAVNATQPFRKSTQLRRTQHIHSTYPHRDGRYCLFGRFSTGLAPLTHDDSRIRLRPVAY